MVCVRELFDDEYFRLFVDEEGIWHLVRSDRPIDQLDDFIATCEDLRDVMTNSMTPGAGPRAMLMDTSQARARNDDDFEERTRQYRRLLRESFERVAVLLGSEVGKLHMARLDRMDGLETAKFTDREQALAWLRAGG